MKILRKCRFLLLLASAVGGASLRANGIVYIPCPRIVIEGDFSGQFEANEKALICPSEKKGAWSRIPLEQRKLHLVRMLQERGYHRPTFTIKARTLFVQTGKKARLVDIEISPKNKFSLIWQRKWLVSSLNPGLLDSIEKQAAEQIKNQGYACVEVKSSVPDPLSGIVELTVKPGKRAILSGRLIHPAKSLKTDPYVLSRHFAFRDGQPYRQYLLNLTQERLEQSRLLQGVYFVENCQNGKLTGITLQGSQSPPRSVSIGVGVDTEGIIKARAEWRHGRWGGNASPVSLVGYASKNLQELSASLEWHSFGRSPRFFWDILGSLRRRSEKRFEDYSLTTYIHPAFALESASGQARISVGPTFERNRTVRGEGKGDFNLPMFDAQINFVSHLLENQIAHPAEGYSFRFQATTTHQDFFSDVTATQLKLSGKKFFFLSSLLPPRIVIAIRGELGTTLNGSAKLPPRFRFFLGGSDTLRGFARRELPANGSGGAITSSFASVELRLNQFLPWGLEPLLFFDAAKLSDRTFSFDGSLWTSPGIGLRWLSPIGLVRTTLAHGFELGSSQKLQTVSNHLQFYIGLGETF